MKVDVSIGEAVDKFCILEIKKSQITDPAKIIHIDHELTCLSECKQYTNSFFYKLLKYVNIEIWKMTDNIKQMNPNDPQYGVLAHKIFEFNQKRFRLKKFFNNNSEIKEQKSYAESHCRIFIDCEETLFNKIAEINYLSLEFDYISFDYRNIDTIKSIFKQPNILYSNQEWSKRIDINNVSIIDKDNIFSFDPISYISGGKLGDFINQLSVINENFYKYGRKGIVYIANYGDAFTFGVDKAFTDLYEIVIGQKYISKFEKYSGQPFNIDLSKWRQSNQLFKGNWNHIYKSVYDVDWGKRKWLDLSFDHNWSDKLVISFSSIRFPYGFDFSKLDKETIFVTTDKSNYDNFKEKTGIELKCHIVSSLTELCTIINSCKLFFGNLSAPLTISTAAFVPSVICITGKEPDDIHNTYSTDFRNDIFYSLELPPQTKILLTLSAIGNGNFDKKLEILNTNLLQFQKTKPPNCNLFFDTTCYNADEVSFNRIKDIVQKCGIRDYNIRSQKGYLGEFLYQHITPEYTKKYDYMVVFLDDVEVNNRFNLTKFIETKNKLSADILSPSLSSDSLYSHEFMKCQYTNVIRTVTVVELFLYLMTPKTWEKYYTLFLSTDTHWTWGIDFALYYTGEFKCCIDDSIPVKHYFKFGATSTSNHGGPSAFAEYKLFETLHKLGDYKVLETY